MATYVNINGNAADNTASPVTTTTSRQINAGEHVVVSIKALVGAGNVTAVDVGGLSLQLDKRQVGTVLQQEMWSAPAASNIASGATISVTWTTSGAFKMTYSCHSLSGVVTSNWVRNAYGFSSASGSSSETTYAPCSNAGDTMVGMCVLNETRGLNNPPVFLGGGTLGSQKIEQANFTTMHWVAAGDQSNDGYNSGIWSHNANVSEMGNITVVYAGSTGIAYVADGSANNKTTGTTVDIVGFLQNTAQPSYVVGDSVFVSLAADGTQTGTPTVTVQSGTATLATATIEAQANLANAAANGTVYLLKADVTGAGTISTLRVTAPVSVAARAADAVVLRGVGAKTSSATSTGSTSTFVVAGNGTAALAANSLLIGAGGWEGLSADRTGAILAFGGIDQYQHHSGNGTTGGGAASNMSAFMTYVKKSSALTSGTLHEWRTTMAASRNNANASAWYAPAVTGSNLTQAVNDTATVADSATTLRGLGALPDDTAAVADAQAFGFGEGVADTAAVTDAQTPAAGFSTTVPDTATVADSASGSLGKFANPADTATVADATVQATGKEANIPDTATVADAQSFGYGEGVADTAAVADAQTTAAGASITVPDTATVADAQTPSSGRSVAVPDSATVADATVQATGKETVIPDTAAVADAQTASAGFSVAPADTATVADATTVSAGFNQAPADTASVADSTSQQSGKETTVPDTLTVADVQAFGYGEGVADTATVADSQSFQSSGGTTITDAIGVADSISTSAAFAISTTDPAAVADALRFDLSASLADALSVADALIPSKGWAAQVDDTLIVADAATTASGVQAALADNVSVADATAIARGISTALADTANVADAQTFQRAIDSAIADAIAVIDGTSFAQGRSIVIPDILVIADARALGMSQHIDDALAVDDALSIIGAGVSAAYIHHVPPLRGDIEPNDSNGLVVAIVADGVVSIYSSSGLVLELDDEGVNV